MRCESFPLVAFTKAVHTQLVISRNSRRWTRADSDGSQSCSDHLSHIVIWISSACYDGLDIVPRDKEWCLESAIGISVVEVCLYVSHSRALCIKWKGLSEVLHVHEIIRQPVEQISFAPGNIHGQDRRVLRQRLAWIPCALCATRCKRELLPSTAVPGGRIGRVRNGLHRFSLDTLLLRLKPCLDPLYALPIMVEDISLAIVIGSRCTERLQAADGVFETV